MLSSKAAAARRPLVILLPGMQCTELTFSDMVPLVQRALPAVAFEVAIVHASDLDAAVTDVLEVIGDRMSAVLVGHSLGASVAMATARTHPEAVVGLACVCANPRSPTSEQRAWWLELRERSREMPAAEWAEFNESILDLWHPSASSARPEHDQSDPNHVALRRRSRRMIDDTGREVLRAQLGVQLSRRDERSGLAAFGKPVLAVAGARDLIVDADRLAEIADLGGGRFVLVEEGDHLTPMSAPAPLADALTSWLEQEVLPTP